MKVSDITNELVANYLRLDFASMTDAEKAGLTAILAAAKSFLKSYTGHVDETATDESLEVDEYDSTIYYTKYSPLVSGTVKVYVNSVEKTENTDYDVDYSNGTITFVESPTVIPTADYTAGIDTFEDFTIAVYVLCQDMYDNRSMYVDKSNINRVVDSILGMHCINLL